MNLMRIHFVLLFLASIIQLAEVGGSRRSSKIKTSKVKGKTNKFNNTRGVRRMQHPMGHLRGSSMGNLMEHGFEESGSGRAFGARAIGGFLFGRKKSVRKFKDGHSCLRKCSSHPSSRMTCFFTFTLTHHYTMSDECGDCPGVWADCFHPKCIPGDGVRRRIDVVNGVLPGPSIDVCEGDHVIVRVHNLLDEATTIHWHGIHQSNTPWMDGTPWVTNCPIPSGSTFDYAFDVPIAGTHFWHSHMGYQRGDGILGPLIVRKPLERELFGPKGLQQLYHYDLPSHVLTIMDWQAEQMRDYGEIPELLLEDFLPNNLLINGRGMQPFFFQREYTITDTMPINEIVVRHGYSYRLRLIHNGIKPCPLEMSIEHHAMHVIASDGMDLDPIVVDSLVLYAGERWDIVIHADQPVGSYWMKWRGYDACNVVSNNTVYQVGILNYVGVPPGSAPHHLIESWDDAAPLQGGKQLNPYTYGKDMTNPAITVAEIHNFHDDDPEIIERDIVDHKFYLSIDFNKVPDGPHAAGPILNANGTILSPQMNDISNVMPHSPFLTQPEEIPFMNLCTNDDGQLKVNVRGSGYINRDGHQDCEEEYCACTHLLRVEYNSIVEVILIDKGAGPIESNHPFHLHGQSFRVVGLEKLKAGGDIVAKVKKMDRKGQLLRRNYLAPIKDAVTVPRGGYTIIRFRANNRGFWKFHCHIEFHLQMGMALIFQTGSVSRMRPPPPNFPKCGNLNAISTDSDEHE